MKHPRKGTNNGRKAEEILRNGKDLREKLAMLPEQEFRKYVREKYDVDSQHVRDWIRVFERFGNRTALIQDLPETMICMLVDPFLEMEIVERLLADRRNGKIKLDCRSMQQAIKEIKEGKNPGKQQKAEEPIISPFSSLLEQARLAKKRIDTKTAIFHENLRENQARISQCNAEKREWARMLHSLYELFSEGEDLDTITDDPTQVTG